MESKGRRFTAFVGHDTVEKATVTGKHRPFTRRAITSEQRELQAAISHMPPKPAPKIKEKRLINGKWTRGYGESISDKMRAVAARLKRGTDASKADATSH